MTKRPLRRLATDEMDKPHSLKVERSKAAPTLKITLRHEIFSMTGYSMKQEKVNQDYSCFHSFLSHKELTRIYVLADGHGTHGHHASRLAATKVIKLLENKITGCPDDLLTDEVMKEFLEESFCEVQLTFSTEEDYPRLFKNSGTTLVIAVIRKLTFYLANCGDSKGFLCHQVGPKFQVALESKEHKPDDPQEQQRVELAGGKVCPFRDYDGSYSGPARVWNKAETEPGLACSRSIGDLNAHQLGVISQPGKFSLLTSDVLMKKLDQSDRFFVLASDGVWDYITPKEVIDKSQSFLPTNNIESCCKRLVNDAADIWNKVDSPSDLE